MQEQAQNTKWFHVDFSTARVPHSGGCVVVFLNARLPSHIAAANPWIPLVCGELQRPDSSGWVTQSISSLHDLRGWHTYI